MLKVEKAATSTVAATSGDKNAKSVREGRGNALKRARPLSLSHALGTALFIFFFSAIFFFFRTSLPFNVYERFPAHTYTDEDYTSICCCVSCCLRNIYKKKKQKKKERSTPKNVAKKKKEGNSRDATEMLPDAFS